MDRLWEPVDLAEDNPAGLLIGQAAPSRQVDHPEATIGANDQQKSKSNRSSATARPVHQAEHLEKLVKAIGDRPSRDSQTGKPAAPKGLIHQAQAGPAGQIPGGQVLLPGGAAVQWRVAGSPVSRIVLGHDVDGAAGGDLLFQEAHQLFRPRLSGRTRWGPAGPDKWPCPAPGLPPAAAFLQGLLKAGIVVRDDSALFVGASLGIGHIDVDSPWRFKPPSIRSRCCCRRWGGASRLGGVSMAAMAAIYGWGSPG